MNKVIVTKFIIGMTATAAMSALVACGQSKTDKQYSDLRNNPASPPISYQEALKQNTVNATESVPGTYVIVLADAAKSATVHEGETVTMSGTARVGIEGVSFKVVLQKAPADAQFVVVDDNGTKRWTLTWKTTPGKIPAGKDMLEVQPEVVIQLGTLNDDQKKMLKNDIASNSTVLGLDIKVVKVSAKPIVKTVLGLDKNPIEGVAASFEIQVNDPGSLSGTPPTLVISNDKAHASADGAVDVASFITPDASKPAVSMGNGDWKFSYIFNSGDKPLPRPAKHSTVGADQGHGMYLVTVTSSSKLASSESESFNLKFNTEKQTPQFAVKDASQTTQVTMGQLNKIDVTVTSSDPAGKLKEDVTGTVAALKLLPSQTGTSAKAACKAATAAGMECEIRWTPSCTADASQSETVQLKAINTIGGISASGTWSQDIKLVKPDNCGVKPAAPAKPVAAAKPAKAGTKPVKPKTVKATAATAAAKAAAAKTPTTATPATPAGAKTAAAAIAAPAAAPAATGTTPAGAVPATVAGNGTKAATASPGGK